ncbi:MAG: hypothetical protein FJY29_03465 [Betaproteobacteria bacterium]|nr:hypothetical protein [Betaproteobacteria bacterium]
MKMNKLNRRDAMRLMMMGGVGATLLKFDPSEILNPKHYRSIDAVQNMLRALQGGPESDRVFAALAQTTSNDVVFVNVKFYMGMNGNYFMKIGNNSIMNKVPAAGNFLQGAGFDRRATRQKHMEASLNEYVSNMIHFGTMDGLAPGAMNVIAGTAAELATEAERNEMLADYHVFGSTGLGGITQHNQQTFNINFDNNPGAMGLGCINYLLENQGILTSPMGVVALGARNRIISSVAGNAAIGVTAASFNQGISSLTADAYVKKSETANLAATFDSLAGPRAREAAQIRERVRASIIDLRTRVASFREVEPMESQAWTSTNSTANGRTAGTIAYFRLAGRAAATGLFNNFAIGVNTIDLNGNNMDIGNDSTLNAVDAIQQTAIGLHMLIKALKRAQKSYVIQVESELSRSLGMGDSGVLSTVTFVGGPKFSRYRSSFLAPTSLRDTNAEAAAFAAGSVLTAQGGSVGAGSVGKDVQRIGVAQIIAEATGKTKVIEDLGRNRLVFPKS